MTDVILEIIASAITKANLDGKTEVALALNDVRERAEKLIPQRSVYPEWTESELDEVRRNHMRPIYIAGFSSAP